ncbi:2-succinyl-6-hydroxy-2,4-cyclohexadiene-1-carboxylate synthase [Lederbergia sp. NSJ-179]|uniref:2-succinyl-6-hydroxy-2, 4-cyclohexadiene-1-carboxylate synthase n=1 Tax=Lederbergia sp. NSJ-179 TaxID=2931402 RepID=UPI001FD38B68|nr:2-succinyl-6-hydroxy-2,4-cyclohexadiene-1-carboxylate synthase [Lederbergia sp. NSJ-179]MCJ7842706.1 2-succinyl-6-hydroxy-2,4-cyclohexadiene-1-carboxylate synthase [Lederbergia sp. NSJ-179]
MIIRVNDVDYFYEMQGKGPVVLLLHGFTGDHTTWTHLKKQLRDDFTLLSVDLLGHGRTSAPTDPARYQIETAAADLTALLEALKIKKVHLLGYSMGGRLALTFAILFPEKVSSLILESASPGLKTMKEREGRVFKDKQLAQMIEKKGIKEFVDYWERIPLFASQSKLPERIRHQIRRQRLDQSPLGLANSLRGMGTGQQPSWWSTLASLSMPIQLICGKKDPKFCQIAEEMKQVIPKASLTCVPDVGHAIHVEDPTNFDTIVKKFLLKAERS